MCTVRRRKCEGATVRRILMAHVLALLLCVAVSACAPRAADILLFTGTGASAGDVAAVTEILNAQSLDFATASSSQLNAMTEASLSRYHLVIVPGGNFEQMGRSLTPEAARRLRQAVRGGVNYLGICAGAFLAANVPYNGLDLFEGVRFPFYSLEAQATRKAAVAIATPDGAVRDHYWEDGPQLSGWGAVVGTYPDGMPAIVQGRVGNGWVVLSGIHAEALESWRGGLTFRTPASETRRDAIRLIDAALHRTELTHF